MATDAELVTRYLEERDEAAFRELVGRHAGPVLRAALAVTNDLAAAEDASQETFLAAMRALRRYDRRRSFRAWLVGIAVHRASNLARGRRRALRREEGAAGPKEGEMQPHEAAQRKETMERVGRALSALPQERRLALQLHFGEGLTHAEIAEALRIAEGTSKSRVARGLEDLRESLRGRGLAVALPDLPAILRALPGAEPSAALVEACCAKAIAAGPAAAALVAWKGSAAVLLLGAAVAGAVGFSKGDAEKPRVSREAPADPAVSTVAQAPAEEGGGAPAGRESSEPHAPPVAAPAPVADADRRVHRAEEVEKVGGARIVRRGGGDAAARGDGEQPAAPAPGENLVEIPGSSPRRSASSRFAPVPAYRGDATVSGRVLDAAGAPVPNAQLFRIAEGADRSLSTVLSFEFLREVGKTGPDGAFEIANHEAGKFLLVADHQRQMVRPRGLETREAARVEVAPGGAVSGIELRIPVVVADLVPFAGRIVDEAGRPLEHVRVFVDYLEAMTGRDGRFSVGPVAPGPRRVQASLVGYEPLEASVEARRGAAEAALLTMRLEEAGTLRLAGLLLDESGEAVPGANLYLTNGTGTLRMVKSDAEGRFAMESLPDAARDGTAALTVWVEGFFPKRVERISLPQDLLEIRIEHSIRLLVAVTSEATGEPIRQIAGELRREFPLPGGGVERRMFRSFSRYSEKGTLDDLDAPAGRVWLILEGPGHEPEELLLDLAPGERTRELAVALRPRP